MSRTVRGRTVRGPVIVAAALLVLVIVAALATAPAGRGATAPNGAIAQPVLGVADLDTTLMGAAPDAGEVWAYRRLPRDVPPPIVSGAPLEFGSAASGDPQLVFLRHFGAAGWQVAQTPLDENGQPYRGMLPNAVSARVTRHGGGLLMGRDPHRPSGHQVVVLLRQPGGRYQALAAPQPTVLLPALGPDPAEALADSDGAGRLATTAFEESGRTAAFFAPVGRAVEDAVIHYDGQAWTREQVDVPSGSASSFQVLDLAATSTANAWMLAQVDSSLNRGVVLFQRVVQSGTPHWVERSLDSTVFAARDTPASGVSALAPLGGSADPLTVTSSGVWIDAGFHSSDGHDYTATLFFDPGSGPGQVTGTWCDAPNGAGALCDHPLGAVLSTKTGYRSFAWPGSGFGTRILTNALPADGNEDANRGAYLSLQGTIFVRVPGDGGNRRRSGAFFSNSDGWLEGPVQVTTQPEGSPMRSWPVALRAPLASIAGEPGKPPGDLGSQALAVGGDGGVARYLPGRGWVREFLLSASGTVSRPPLRAVAWPEPGRAYAVGDVGAMWLWRADTGLWEKDPAAPIGGEANFMDVAFDPGNPDRGYAVGKGGTLLRYGKTWEQDAVPGGLGSNDFTQVAFAGSQALVAAGTELLVNDGGGWHVDPQVHALLDPLRANGVEIYSVAGLPDGGAVVGGRDFVLERDSAGAPWRFADQPLLSSTVVAAAAVREGGRVRAVVSVVPRQQYPIPDLPPQQDPNQPAPVIPPFPLPGDGYVLRETASGWHDDQHTAFSSADFDRPVKSDPILDFDLDAGGQGWAVGGWSGEPDSAGRGTAASGASGFADRSRVQTAGAFRYGDAAAAVAAPTAGTDPVPLPAGPARFAVAAHAQCENPCADLALQAIGPDRTLSGALGKVGALAAQPNGPRMLLYAGGRERPPNALTSREADRYAEVLGQSPVPVYAATSAGDAVGGDVGPLRSAFAGFNAPFGQGGAPGGVDTSGIPGAAPGPGARTHYAFDSDGAGGRVRIVVIDNSAGSLAASDPYQNPAEAQLPWLGAVLADARGRGIPTVVMGSRDLNQRITPSLNTASDGTAVANVLVAGGASAYVFERPEENRTYRIPGGSAQTIPSFGTGTLGYRSSISGSSSAPDSLFGDAGFLMLEVDAAHRDAATNRAPVGARLIPVVDDVSLQAVDGVLLRRSRPSLFQGLGRRPLAGDRWGLGSADGSRSPPGADPYTSFPPGQCLIPGCSSRIAPEYRFTSSDPDIGDFVRQDPNSSNLRKPFQDANNKVVTDNASGLFCPFNAGTTTVTVRAGGLAYAQQVTVLGGSVQQPCGTRPLNPNRFSRVRPSENPASPPPPAPAPSPTPVLSLPPPPGAVPLPAVLTVPRPLKVPTPVSPPVPRPTPLAVFLPVIVPPPLPLIARPIPPGGAVARVYQVEEKREEEVAPEETQAFSRYSPEDHSPPAAWVLAGLVLAALAGAAIATASRGRGGGRRIEAAVAASHSQRQSRSPYRRRRS